MLWIMIKNNLKLMFRSKLLLAIVLIAPIIVMGALSNAFDGLLSSDYEFENINIGCYTKEGSLLDSFVQQGKDELKENKITIKKCDLSEGKTQVEERKLEAFIYEEDEDVKLYTLNPNSIPTEMCQFIISDFYAQCGNMTATTQVSVDTKKLDSLKLSTAGNYYGIIEIVYFLWVGMLFLTAVVQSERKNRISQRFISAPTNPVIIYMSKYIPCVIMVIGSTVISMIASTLLFDVEWGNLLKTSGILFVAILAGTAFGITCLYLVNNLAVSVILLFSVVWGWGFVGGSFETYMFSSVPEKIKCFSPIYYINRTLVEYSTMGHSDYAVRCIIISLTIFVVFSILGSLLMKGRMEDE